jgi:hypothetical protein
MKAIQLKYMNVGTLPALLWIILGVSVALMIALPWGEENFRAEDYRRSLGGDHDARDRENWYLRKLANAVNPLGVAPITMTLSAGFLAVLRAQRVAATLMLAALQAAPDATAEAIRRTAKAKPPAVPAAVPPPAPIRATGPDDWDLPVGPKK